MTVPFLAGWEDIVAVLAVMVAVAVAFLVIAATGLAANSQSEWRAWLDGRASRGRLDAATDPHVRSNELVRPDALVITD